MMGHCVVTVDPWTILVVGGFSPETADYIDQAYFLDTKTNEWYTKPWSKLKYGKGPSTYYVPSMGGGGFAK